MLLVRSVMSVYNGAKTRVRVDIECQRKVNINLGCMKDLYCHFCFYSCCGRCH